MTLLQARTTKVALCVVVFFVASGFATVIPVTNPSFETMRLVGLPEPWGTGCFFSMGAISGWTNSGDSGRFQPGTQHPFDNRTFFDFVPDSITSAHSTGGTISQVVGTVQEGENLRFDG